MAALDPWFTHPSIAHATSKEIRTRLGISPNHASFRAGVLRTHLLTALFAHSAARHLDFQVHVAVRWDDSDSRRSREEHRQNLLHELTRVAQIPIEDEKDALRQSRRGDRYREALRELDALRLLVTERGLLCLDVAAVDRSMKTEGVYPESLTACASMNDSVPRAPAQDMVPLIRSDGRALGGFNWLSQHLDQGVWKWDDLEAGVLLSPVGRRCAHQDDRPPTRARSSAGSGPTSLKACRPRTPQQRAACQRRSDHGGSVRLVECRLPP